MIAVAKKKAVRKDDDNGKRDRYRVYTQESLAEAMALVQQRVDEIGMTLRDMQKHGIETVGIDGAGAMKRGLDELDAWIDLVSTKVVIAKRRRLRESE